MQVEQLTVNKFSMEVLEGLAFVILDLRLTASRQVHPYRLSKESRGKHRSAIESRPRYEPSHDLSRRECSN